MDASITPILLSTEIRADTKSYLAEAVGGAYGDVALQPAESSSVLHGHVTHTSNVLPVLDFQFRVGNRIPIQRRIEGNGEFVDRRPNESHIFLLCGD